MIGLGIGENVFGDGDSDNDDIGHELWGQDATTRRKERREKSACFDDALQIGIEDRRSRDRGTARGALLSFLLMHGMRYRRRYRSEKLVRNFVR